MAPSQVKACASLCLGCFAPLPTCFRVTSVLPRASAVPCATLCPNQRLCCCCTNPCLAPQLRLRQLQLSACAAAAHAIRPCSLLLCGPLGSAQPASATLSLGCRAFALPPPPTSATSYISRPLQEKMQLYSGCRSSCSWRVRIALAYKGLEYEYKAVSLVEGGQFGEDFRKLNAFSTVPVLVDNGFVIADSCAILEYLEDKYPEPSLFPADVKKKALVRQVVNHVAASIQPLQNLSVLKKIEALVGSEERLKWAQHFIESGFKALESLLTAEAGVFCFGDEFTMADVVLVPQLANANRFQVDMAKFPLLKRIGDAASALPWMEQAIPENQPDFVP